MHHIRHKTAIQESKERKFKTYTRELKREVLIENTHTVKPLSAHIHVDGLQWLKNPKIKLFARICGSKYNIQYNFLTVRGWVGEDVSMSHLIPKGVSVSYYHSVDPEIKSIVAVDLKDIAILLHEIGHSIDSNRRERFERKSRWSKEVFASRWALRWINRLIPEYYDEALETLAEGLSTYEGYDPKFVYPPMEPYKDICKKLLNVRSYQRKIYE